MKISIKTKLAAGFGIALILIAFMAFFSWTSTVNLVNNAQMVDHTHQVLESLENIVSQLKDIETGQRGFVITGEAHYLEPYNAGLAGVEFAVAEVRILTSDNPSQQRRLNAVELLIRLKNLTS